MFGFKIDQAKGLFFDRPAVTRAADAGTRRALSKFGAFVRRRARSSIRQRKGVAPAGQPPSSHLDLLKRWILFAYEPNRRSVVIGPARLNAKVGNAPEALEYGGPSHALLRRQRRRVLVTTQVGEHPYMRPAYAAELPKAAGLFRDEVH